MANRLRPTPIYTNCGEMLEFKYLGFSFISLFDAENFRVFRNRVGVHIPDENNKVSLTFHLCGIPQFVNVEKSIETGNVIYYDYDEIQWESNPKDFNP